MSNFDAKQHLIKMGSRMYLETKWRLVWFREEHPHGCITTEIVSLDPVLIKATVYNSEGAVLATAHAGAVDTGKAVWSGRVVEKAETGAIGRALGHAGFGTQFTDDDEVESGHLADSPIDSKKAAKQLGNGGNRRAVQPGTIENHHAVLQTGVTERDKETLLKIFNQVEIWFADDSTEGGKKKHMKNLIAQLESEGVLAPNAPIDKVVLAIIANREKVL